MCVQVDRRVCWVDRCVKCFTGKERKGSYVVKYILIPSIGISVLKTYELNLQVQSVLGK